MSFLCPPPGFPLHLVAMWPLIWLQVLMLRAYVRATYGPGTPYRWSVTLCGRAYITCIDPKPEIPPAWLAPSPYRNRLLVAALEPLLPREKGLGMRGNGLAAGPALAEMPRPLTPTPLPRERGLPAPET